jgi:hypothetical protein
MLNLTATPFEFSQIQFDHADHAYTAPDGKPLQSVTKVVKGLRQPFKADYWAERKAAERGISKEAILAEWDAKGQAGRERGTALHTYIEHLVREVPYSPPIHYPEMNAFEGFWVSELPSGSVARCEWVVGCPEWGIAGTLDLLYWNPATQKYHIYDWKTGGKFALANRYERMQAPFADLDDCEFNAYSLQVSLYRLLVEAYTSLPLGDSYIAHFAPDGSYRVHTALDLRDRLRTWLQTNPLQVLA